ncbi:MAG: hypothetical protein AAGI07_10725, partial [Bacteroidota bacterium]
YMKQIYISCLFSSILILYYQTLSAQQSTIAENTSKNEISNPAYDFTTSLYQDSIVVGPLIYRGDEYKYYNFRIEGHQFFYADEAFIGNVFFDGFLYKNVQLLYDIYLKQLVIEHDNLAYSISIENKLVDYFDLFGHHFVRLKEDSNRVISDGFYDLLVDGDVKFYVKREKSLQKTLENQRVIQWFELETRYYAYKDGGYHKVKKKGSILKLLQDQKKTLKTYLKKQKIYFGKDPENGLTETIKYYNTIKL